MTDHTPEIRVLAGNPTPTEVAAVTAVLTAALGELAVNARRSNDDTPTAWMRSQRSVRIPLTPGTWQTFGH